MGEVFRASVVGLMLGLMFSLISTLLIGGFLEEAYWHKTTVERGLAQYCPADGNWARKGECK